MDPAPAGPAARAPPLGGAFVSIMHGMEFPDEIRAVLVAHPGAEVLFIDEAGTDAQSKVTAVAGFLVNPNGPAWMIIEAMAKGLWTQIPEQYREGFVSRCAEMFDPEKWPEWDIADRKEFLIQLMSLPRLYGCPIVSARLRPSDCVVCPPGLRDENVRHLLAFGICVASADQLIRIAGRPGLSAITIAEDSDAMRDHLLNVFRRLETEPWIFEEEVVGVGPPLDFRIQRMLHEPFFMPKGSLALQIADALVYGAKRAWAGLSHGADYYRAIFGSELPMEGNDLPLGRMSHIPPPPGRFTVISDPNGMFAEKFGLKIGQTIPMFNMK